VAAVLASAGAGLASPALVRIVARSVAASQVARTQTIVNAGTGPGLVVAGLLALVLLPDWRAAWVVSAVCAVLAGVAVLRADGGSGARAAEPTTDRAALPPASWFRQHAPLLAAALLLGAGSAAVWNYGRALLVEVGAGRTVSVVAWIALGLGGAAVIGTARWTDARSPRTAWTVTVLAVAVGTLGLGLGAPVTPVALVACVVFGWGYTAGTGALIAWTSDLDAAHAPSGTSMLFVTLVLGQALGAAVAGTGIDTIGSGVTLVVAALVALAAVPVARTVGHRDRRDRRDGLRRDAVRQNGLP
jgi:predicted MFS family arabinose efflux permease